jgi:prepilin-type N-terminal cleavage/methylation domain-containing protein
MKQKGFTLVELLVVIAIIGLLSSVVLVSLNINRMKARDARRMHDLDQIRTALVMYYDKYGNYMEDGSGCGRNGTGTGWFNFSGPYYGNDYVKAMSKCLKDEGITQSEIIDPSGARLTDINWVPYTGHSYMKYHCTVNGKKVVYIYASLETKPLSNTATNGTCCEVCDEWYKMNYYTVIN